MFRLFLIFVVATASIQSESIIGLTIGSSFRSCVGYCWKSVHINSTSVHTCERNLANSTSSPDLHHDFRNIDGEFENLVESVGNIQMWKTIDSPIGCPDCQNQGAQWIEVFTDNQPKYGVTFDSNSTIVGYETLVDQLRSIHRRYFP